MGLERIPGLERIIRLYRNGRDLTNRPRGVTVIDLFGLKEVEVRKRFPEVYQWVLEKVKPERKNNRRLTYRNSWWIFGEPRKNIRPFLRRIDRYIATVETAKHRVFQFLDKAILPDNMLVVIASPDAYHLGVLQSRIHVTWALACGGKLGPTPVYVKTLCFSSFPFPDANPEQEGQIRSPAQELDDLRKRQLELHSDLTLTDMYNVLEKLKAKEALTPKEEIIKTQGLVSTLQQLHHEIDAAVFAAYGWDSDIDDEEILRRLIALNQERQEEEMAGNIRWLQSELQSQIIETQTELDIDEPSAEVKPEKAPWPKTMPEQVMAVRKAIASGIPADPALIAQQFKSARKEKIAEILSTLAMLG